MPVCAMAIVDGPKGRLLLPVLERTETMVTLEAAGVAPGVTKMLFRLDVSAGPRGYRLVSVGRGYEFTGSPKAKPPVGAKAPRTRPVPAGRLAAPVRLPKRPRALPGPPPGLLSNISAEVLASREIGRSALAGGGGGGRWLVGHGPLIWCA